MLRVRGLSEDLLTPWHRDQTPVVCQHTCCTHTHTHIYDLFLSHTQTHTRGPHPQCQGWWGVNWRRVKLTTVAQSSERKWLHHTLRRVMSRSHTHKHTRQGVFNSVGVWPGALLKPLSQGPLLHRMNCPFITWTRLSCSLKATNMILIGWTLQWIYYEYRRNILLPHFRLFSTSFSHPAFVFSFVFHFQANLSWCTTFIFVLCLYNKWLS